MDGWIYLTCAYGDWRTPDRLLEATHPAPNIDGGYPPISRAYVHYALLRGLLDGDREKAASALAHIRSTEGENEALESFANALQPSGILPQS